MSEIDLLQMDFLEKMLRESQEIMFITVDPVSEYQAMAHLLER